MEKLYICRFFVWVETFFIHNTGIIDIMQQMKYDIKKSQVVEDRTNHPPFPPLTPKFLDSQNLALFFVKLFFNFYDVYLYTNLYIHCTKFLKTYI